MEEGILKSLIWKMEGERGIKNMLRLKKRDGKSSCYFPVHFKLIIFLVLEYKNLNIIDVQTTLYNIYKTSITFKI